MKSRGDQFGINAEGAEEERNPRGPGEPGPYKSKN